MRDKGPTRPRETQSPPVATKRQRQSTRSKTAEEQAARRKEKQPASSSVPSTEPTPIVWPRQEGVPFQIPDSFVAPTSAALIRKAKQRSHTTEWDVYDSYFYNGLLKMTFEPTRLVSREFCEHVGWFGDIKRLCRFLGLGTMPFKHYTLYPDLARQFLGSCRVYYGEPDDPQEDDGGLFFKLDGKNCFVSFEDICVMFGFNVAGTVQQIPDDDAACQGLWREITGLFPYVPSTAKHTQVKHPVLRLFLRMVSNTLLCKMEPGKMRRNELILLHYTIGHMFEYDHGLDMSHKLNFGAIFAHVLEELKFRGLSGSEKIETVGSLLTPFFTKFSIDLAGRTKDDRPGTIDEKSLKKGNFLKGEWGNFKVCFVDDEDTLRLLPLPSHLCRIDSAEALRFQPQLGDMVRDGFRQERRVRQAPVDLAAGSSSRTTQPPPSCPLPLPPFEEPPAGTYEDNPLMSWLVRTARTAWQHWRATCCTRTSDAIPPQHQPQTTHGDDEHDEAPDSDDASTSGSPVF